MTTSSRVALKAGGTQMNGEISGKKIQNMDIMEEVRKNKYILDFFKRFLWKTKIVQGEFYHLPPCVMISRFVWHYLIVKTVCAHSHYGNTGCGVFKGGIQNLEGLAKSKP